MTGKETHEIVYADGSSEGLLVSSVAPNLYRLEESSMLGGAVFGDIIEAEMGPDGRLQFKRVASASEMDTVSCLNWERAFDRVLLVHLPQSVHLDVVAEIKLCPLNHNRTAALRWPQCPDAGSASYRAASETATNHASGHALVFDAARGR